MSEKETSVSYNDQLRAAQYVFTFNISLLIQYAHFIGLRLSFGEAFRTEDQQYLYYNGKTIVDGALVTAPKRSWTMDGQHLKRLAVDFNFFEDDDHDGVYELNYKHPKVKELGKFWESLNEKNRWGGNFTTQDWPHFEMKF